MTYEAGTPVTIHEAGTLGQIICACERNARVGWLPASETPTRPGQVVLYGTSRSIGTESGDLDFTSDVRSCFIRITTDLGFEHFMPVSRAAVMYDSGMLVIDVF